MSRFFAVLSLLLIFSEKLWAAAPLTATPTDGAQYMLQLINLARSNPWAMGQKLYSDAHSDPVLVNATKGENLSLFLQVIDGFPAEPPLAFHTGLIAAAIQHSQAMLAANSQFHSASDYLLNPVYGFNNVPFYAQGNGAWSVGENIFAYSANVVGKNITDYDNYFEAAFLLDWGNPDFGHLLNILAPGPSQWSLASSHFPYREIGIGLLTGVSPANPSSTILNVGPDIVTQEFGYNSGNPILMGCFYTDWLNSSFYYPGEGLGNVTIKATVLGGTSSYQTKTWSTGGFSLPLPPGTYAVTASGGAIPTPVEKTVTIQVDNVVWDYAFHPVLADQPVPARYYGGKTDRIAVYRESSAQWFLDGQSAPINFGGPGIDVPVPGDYDGVGYAELAVYRPSTSEWFVRGPNGGKNLGQFGGPGMDIPVPGDYYGAGNGKIWPAVYRPSTAQWFALGNGDKNLIASFGAPNSDIPVPGDYDGIGHLQPAVYRPSTGDWFVWRPQGGKLIANFRGTADLPVPGDYFGLGHLQPAVYRPSTGEWFVLSPNGGKIVAVLGLANVDVPLRFSSDGKSYPVSYRPTTGQWFDPNPSGGYQIVTLGLGGWSVPVNTWLSNFLSHPTGQITHAFIGPQ